MSNTLVTLMQDCWHLTVLIYQSAQMSPKYFKNHQKDQNKLSYQSRLTVEIKSMPLQYGLNKIGSKMHRCIVKAI